MVHDERPPSTGRGTILLVDDEAGVRRATQRLLDRQGYRVVTASDGERGVEACRRGGAGFSLVILDLSMPVMGGEDAFELLRAEFPHLPILLSSGHASGTRVDSLIARGAAGFLPKPFRVEAMIQVVAQAMVESARPPDLRAPSRR